MRIQQNIEEILRELPQGTALCAVTKYHSVEETKAVIGAGILDIGENKVQDLLYKQELIGDPRVRWHMIGHLQTNKVRKLIGHTALIHSVDSLKLIQVIEQESAAQQVNTHILLELGLTGEESKFGLTPEEMFDLLPVLAEKKHITLRGLMGMGAVANHAEENRKIFKQLYQLYVTIKEEYLGGQNEIDTLSMGMTDDYPIAAEEGATIVRIGRKIFK